MTLKSKNLLFTAVILLPVIVSASYLIIVSTENQFVKDDIEKVSLVTDIIKNGLITMMLQGEGKDFRHFLDILIAEDISGVHIVGNNGRLISSASSLNMDRKLYSDVLSRFEAFQSAEIISTESNGKAIYSAIVPIFNERPCQRCHGDKHSVRGILNVEFLRTKSVRKISENRSLTIVVAVMTFFILLIASDYINKKLVTAPLKGLSESIRTSSGDGGKLVNNGRDNEIAGLGKSFGSLLSEKERLLSEKVQMSLELEMLDSYLDNLRKAMDVHVGNPLSKAIGDLQVLAEETDFADSRSEIINNMVKDLMAIKASLDKDIRGEN